MRELLSLHWPKGSCLRGTTCLRYSIKNNIVVLPFILPVLDVLVCEGIVGVGGLVVAVGTLLPSLALSLDPEAADVRPVALVVGGRTRKLGQQLVLLAAYFA